MNLWITAVDALFIVPGILSLIPMTRSIYVLAENPDKSIQ